MNKIKCFFGFHNWHMAIYNPEYVCDYIKQQTTVCRNCNKFGIISFKEKMIGGSRVHIYSVAVVKAREIVKNP